MQRSTFLKLLTGSVVSAFTLRGQWIFADPLPFYTNGVPSGLRPYLHLNRPTSIWISWWTNNESNSFVDFGTSAANLNQTTSGSRHTFNSTNKYHSVKLTGLTPNTYYHYRVRTNSTTSETFRFKTPPTTGTKNSHFRALIIGDNQIFAKESTGDPYYRYEKLMDRAITKIRALHSNKPIEEIIDVIIMPGDQVDYGTLHHWRNLHFYCTRLVSPNVSIMTTVGNHELYGDTGLANYRQLFNYTEVNYAGLDGADGDSYYAHQISNVVFIHTNSEFNVNTEPAKYHAQTQWVQNLSNSYASDSSVDWVVSICHRPYQAEQYLGDISSWLRNTAMPILNQSDKHFLNVGAHHHIYHRGQVRDAPNYHIISGGSAWDQYWGQSTEDDYDDVQKSINNWAWQLLEVDQTTNKAEVTCYSEAHCLIPAASRWSYNSKEIDRFHRIRGKAAPAQPSLVNLPASTTLPLTLQSSLYTTPTDELLNSVQYQISASPTFNSFEIDEIVDFENFYGDTGAPDYTPVDINAGRNILEYTLAQNSIPNGTFYLRIRHRDRNATWSPWSASQTLTIQGSNASNPTITLPKSIYSITDDITVDYAFGPGNARDWIGVYVKGENPGGPGSTRWEYTSGTAGSLTLTKNKNDFTAGTEYYVGYFINDGYTEIAPRVPFYAGNKTILSTPNYDRAIGENVPITFSNADTPATINKLHLYRAGQNPISSPPLQSSDINSSNGTWNLDNLTKGYYFVVAQANTGTLVISDPLEFSVGETIADLTIEKSSFTHGENFNVSYINGPANPKDYIGIFPEGDVPGIGELVHYKYVDGLADNTIEITEDLPVGNYFLALFTNDSYTEVSNRASFKVEPQIFPLSSFEIDMSTNTANLSWQTEESIIYTLQRSPNLKDWTDVSSLTGTGNIEQLATTVTPTDTKCFFRVIIK